MQDGAVGVLQDAHQRVKAAVQGCARLGGTVVGMVPAPIWGRKQRAPQQLTARLIAYISSSSMPFKVGAQSVYIQRKARARVECSISPPATLQHYTDLFVHLKHAERPPPTAGRLEDEKG